MAKNKRIFIITLSAWFELFIIFYSYLRNEKIKKKLL